jgi:hypothetical protein
MRECKTDGLQGVGVETVGPMRLNEICEATELQSRSQLILYRTDAIIQRRTIGSGQPSFSRVSVLWMRGRQNLEVAVERTLTSNDWPSLWEYIPDMPSDMDNMADEHCINTVLDARGHPQ